MRHGINDDDDDDEEESDLVLAVGAALRGIGPTNPAISTISTTITTFDDDADTIASTLQPIQSTLWASTLSPLRPIQSTSPVHALQSAIWEPASTSHAGFQWPAATTSRVGIVHSSVCNITTTTTTTTSHVRFSSRWTAATASYVGIVHSSSVWKVTTISFSSSGCIWNAPMPSYGQSSFPANAELSLPIAASIKL